MDVRQFVPKESKRYPGFYIVPGHPLYLISKDDKVITSTDGTEIPVKVNSFYGGYQYARSQAIHRLKCLAFNGPVVGYAKKMVNHKDGNKLNNDPDNLEWVTAKENAQHAYEFGLREDNTPVLVKDTKTDEVVRYYALWAAARALKVNAGTIHKWLNRRDRSAHVFQNRYVIILEGEEWPVLTKDDFSRVIKGTPVPIMVIDLQTAEQTIYTNIREAGRALNLNGATLSVYLSRCVRGESLKFRGYEFIRLEDPDLIRKMRDSFFKTVKRGKLNKRKPIPIEVTNLETGDVKQWPSCEALAKSLNVSKNTLQKGIYVGNGVWRGMNIVYLADK